MIRINLDSSLRFANKCITQHVIRKHFSGLYWWTMPVRQTEQIGQQTSERTITLLLCIHAFPRVNTLNFAICTKTHGQCYINAILVSTWCPAHKMVVFSGIFQNSGKPNLFIQLVPVTLYKATSDKTVLCGCKLLQLYVYLCDTLHLNETISVRILV